MSKQCELLHVNRLSLYYEPVGQDTEELDLMKRMDQLHLKHPFFGSRMMAHGFAYLVAIIDWYSRRVGIGAYMHFFNGKRPHKALGCQTPANFYDGLLSEAA
jgi:hypothetical protein